MPAILRFGIGLLVLLGLLTTSACAVDSRLTPDAQFNQQAASASGTGLIVMGIRVSKEPIGHDWLRGAYAINPVYSFDLARLGMNGRLQRPFRRLQICDSSRVLFQGALTTCVPEMMDYRVVSVAAGRYLLADFVYQTHGLAVESNYISPDLRPKILGLPGSDIGVGDRVRSPERSVYVGPGEIVYIGDMSFDASRHFVMIDLSRNDQAAQAALRNFPGVQGKMVFRSVSGSPS